MISQRLASDPTLAKVCGEFAKEIQDAASDDAEALARSEHLTREDLTIVINARAGDLLVDNE